MTVYRETYWRVFSTELNASTFEIKADEDMKPSYQLSPLGAMISRVLIAGVLTEKENVGSEDEPMWRGRIQDVAGGTVYINIGRYQPDAANAMRDIDTPSIVAVIGKVKSYTNEDQRTFVSVRPERIVPINAEIQNQWLLDTAKTTWQRLVAMKRALSEVERPEPGTPRAQSIDMAITQYGQPDSSMYLKAIQAALRNLLPERNVDFGIPGDDLDGPEEFDMDSGAVGFGAPASSSQAPVAASDASPSGAPAAKPASSSDPDAIVLNLLQELNTDGKGAPRDELENRCAEEGISSMELEEIIENLLDKGLAYEPNLKYIKKIED